MESLRGLKRLLEQILRSEPENVEALWMIARLLERRGEIDSWLETLENLCKFPKSFMS